MTAIEVISRVKTLDEKATEGKWTAIHDPFSFHSSSIVTQFAGRLFDSTSHGKMREDSTLAAEYRSLAPKMARALEIATKKLLLIRELSQRDEDEALYAFSGFVLSEIDAIFSEGE